SLVLTRHTKLYSSLFPYTTLFRSGRGNRARRAKKSRARNCPFFNRLLDLYVSVSRAFGFHVPQSCESLLERTARRKRGAGRPQRSEEHTSELQSRGHLVCRLLL